MSQAHYHSGSALIVFEGGDATVKAQRHKVSEEFDWRSDWTGERHGDKICVRMEDTEETPSPKQM